MTHLKIWVKIWDIIIILENNHKIYVQTVNGTLNLIYDSYKYHFSMCCTKKKNLLKDISKQIILQKRSTDTLYKNKTHLLYMHLFVA